MAKRCSNNVGHELIVSLSGVLIPVRTGGEGQANAGDSSHCKMEVL